MDERKELIQQMRHKRMTYLAIGRLLGISRQRAHQIHIGYRSPSQLPIPPEKHKLWTTAKRASMGLPDISYSKSGVVGGRDFIRELVRIRDKHTCQICLRVWKEGERRFDVHHQEEQQEGKSFEKNAVKRDKKSFDKMITLCHKCHLNLETVKKKIKDGTVDAIRRNKRNSAIPKAA